MYKKLFGLWHTWLIKVEHKVNLDRELYMIRWIYMWVSLERKEKAKLRNHWAVLHTGR